LSLECNIINFKAAIQICATALHLNFVFAVSLLPASYSILSVGWWKFLYNHICRDANIMCPLFIVLGDIWIWFAEFIGHCRQW